MKFIIYIFTFYFAILALLPPVYDCSVGNTHHRNELNNQSNLQYGDNSILCSPFCGEEGCGIVVDFRSELSPVIASPFLKTDKSVMTVNSVLIRHVYGIWHPPKT